MIEPLSILTIIAFSLWVEIMTGMIIFSVICVVGLGVMIAMGATE